MEDLRHCFSCLKFCESFKKDASQEENKTKEKAVNTKDFEKEKGSAAIEKKSLKMCSGCHMVGYCDYVCQKKHWKEAHKLECKKLRERWESDWESCHCFFRVDDMSNAGDMEKKLFERFQTMLKLGEEHKLDMCFFCWSNSYAKMPLKNAVFNAANNLAFGIMNRNNPDNIKKKDTMSDNEKSVKDVINHFPEKIVPIGPMDDAISQLLYFFHFAQEKVFGQATGTEDEHEFGTMLAEVAKREWDNPLWVFRYLKWLLSEIRGQIWWTRLKNEKNQSISIEDLYSSIHWNENMFFLANDNDEIRKITSMLHEKYEYGTGKHPWMEGILFNMGRFLTFLAEFKCNGSPSKEQTKWVNSILENPHKDEIHENNEDGESPHCQYCQFCNLTALRPYKPVWPSVKGSSRDHEFPLAIQHLPAGTKCLVCLDSLQGKSFYPFHLEWRTDQTHIGVGRFPRGFEYRCSNENDKNDDQEKRNDHDQGVRIDGSGYLCSFRCFLLTQNGEAVYWPESVSHYEGYVGASSLAKDMTTRNGKFCMGCGSLEALAPKQFIEVDPNMKELFGEKYGLNGLGVKLFPCPRCNDVLYCNQNCLREDRPKHKSHCKSWVKRFRESEAVTVHITHEPVKRGPVSGLCKPCLANSDKNSPVLVLCAGKLENGKIGEDCWGNIDVALSNLVTLAASIKAKKCFDPKTSALLLEYTIGLRSDLRSLTNEKNWKRDYRTIKWENVLLVKNMLAKSQMLDDINDQMKYGSGKFPWWECFLINLCNIRTLLIQVSRMAGSLDTQMLVFHQNDFRQLALLDGADFPLTELLLPVTKKKGLTMPGSSNIHPEWAKCDGCDADIQGKSVCGLPTWFMWNKFPRAFLIDNFPMGNDLKEWSERTYDRPSYLNCETKVVCSRKCFQKFGLYRLNTVGNILSTFDQAVSQTINGVKGTICFYCGNVSRTLLQCSQCRNLHYCNLECQEKDWLRHEPNCIGRKKRIERKKTDKLWKKGRSGKKS